MSEEGEQSIDMQLDPWWGSHDVFAAYTDVNWDGEQSTYSPWDGVSDEDDGYFSSKNGGDVVWILYVILILLFLCGVIGLVISPIINNAYANF